MRAVWSFPPAIVLLLLWPALAAANGAAADAATPAAVPPGATVYAVATSHLDTQWRWDIRTTIDEYLLNTLDDNFALLEKYPDYIFNFEGAFRYQLMQEYYPERFERLRAYVRQGRWRVCGSWLDAVDVNIPSPESLFRQALYGNGWFRRELGTESVDVYLPDCFGFGFALPSVMAHAGLKGFTTQKLTWGSAYGLPFDLGRWRGVDGSEVLAAVNPGSYSSDLPGDVSRDTMAVAAVARTAGKGGPALAYRFYGTGDTGGSPSESSVALLEESLSADGPLRVVSAGADQIYRELTAAQAASLPVYDGELVMTRHGTGCYTSEAAMKRWYRRCETLADAAERAASLAWVLGGRNYPQEELERAWTRFLWHGFHDDLTGTSIPEAYTYSWNDLLLSQQEFVQVLESSLQALGQGMETGGPGAPVLLFNPLAFARTEVIEVQVPPSPASHGTARVFGPDGAEVPSRQHGNRVHFVANVPASGVTRYVVQPDAGQESPAPQSGWDAKTGTLETLRYRLRFGPEGLLSLFDKQVGRELLSEPPCLQLLRDDPKRWSAWEIDYDDLMAEPYARVPLGGVPESVDSDPLRARLTFTHEAAGSVFRQTLTVAGDRIDWDLDIDWASTATLLKAAFFTTARDTAVTYDLGLGSIRRGVNRPRLYEVPAQRWADLTDASGEFGLTVMNDSRYGWDHPDAGTLRLTLLHTPAIAPDWRWLDDQKSQDLGLHRLKIGLLGHDGDWRDQAVRQADALNQPLLAFAAPLRGDDRLGGTVSLLAAQGAAVRAVKKAEQGDWLVVRLQETTGRPATGVTLEAIAPIVAVRELRADEVEITRGEDLVLKDGILTCELRPYQPRTLALQLAPIAGVDRLTLPASEPLALPWNQDGISPCADPTDGDWDGTGCSLPSERIPANFMRDGVKFVTGPRGAGEVNLLRCAGQTLDLSASAMPYVQLLVCSRGAARDAQFLLGRRATTAWIPSGGEWFGQWDSRLGGEDAVHTAGQLTPAFLTDRDLGWIVTHLHEPDGRTRSYAYTNFYRLTIDRRRDGGPAGSLTLPDDPDLVILAASLTDAGGALFRDPGGEFLDQPRRPSVSLVPAGGTFVDSLVVRVVCHTPGAAITVAPDGQQPRPWTGEPLVLTDSAAVTVTAVGDFQDSTVRRAWYTRVDPWPAAADGGEEPGLNTRTYLGAWDRLPDWATLTPAAELVQPTVTVPAGVPDEDIGAVLTGAIVTPRRGVYRFWLSSDDGSRLWIDGRQVVDNDGLHGSSPVRGDVPLEAGLHTIEVEFFQHLGGVDLVLEWSGPGIARQEVPAGVFRH